MMISDIAEGLHAQELVVTMQDQNRVCQAEKAQVQIINESLERDAVSLIQENDNLKEVISNTEDIAKNERKLQKKKRRRLRNIAIGEGLIIVLLILII